MQRRGSDCNLFALKNAEKPAISDPGKHLFTK
jgi:hypothetical protein